MQKSLVRYKVNVFAHLRFTSRCAIVKVRIRASEQGGGQGGAQGGDQGRTQVM